MPTVSVWIVVAGARSQGVGTVVVGVNRRCPLLLPGGPWLYGEAFIDAVLYGFLLVPRVLAGGVGQVAGAALTGRGCPG